MNKLHLAAVSVALLTVTLFVAIPASAQWSAEPGTTVRNAFGPQAGDKPAQCRGACGAGCPDSCAKEVTYECLDSSRLRQVVTYACGTHRGCRVHDDCLDVCEKSGARSGNCQTQCDAQVMQTFGVESSASWLTGRGPYDGKVQFEYTRDAPGALEPAYICPSGAKRQCSANSGCVAESGARVDPVFDSYPAAGAGAMRVSKFRSGPACGSSVCAQSADIKISGADSCAGGRCTRFGMEFDYQNADPSAPLECRTSTSGGEGDFIGDLLKLGADASASRGGLDAKSSSGQGGDGMAELLGMFGKVLASGDSPEDINVSMAPLDKDGNPIESQRVGSTPRDGPPPIPSSVALPAANGHLFVPMYQMADAANPAAGKERRVRCTHKGVPVLETTFRFN